MNLERMWKEWVWPVLKYRPIVYLNKIRETENFNMPNDQGKILTQDFPCMGW